MKLYNTGQDHQRVSWLRGRASTRQCRAGHARGEKGMGCGATTYIHPSIHPSSHPSIHPSTRRELPKASSERIEHDAYKTELGQWKMLLARVDSSYDYAFHGWFEAMSLGGRKIRGVLSLSLLRAREFGNLMMITLCG